MKMQLVILTLFIVMKMALSSGPNIVIMIADDLGIGDVGCFGNKTLRTPNIDSIASEGVKMTHHLTAASVCTPSRAALMTGRYPIRMGMAPTHIMRVNSFTSSVSGLPPKEITFAELAKEKGYQTALIGKWHLGLHSSNVKDFALHPQNQGFDYFYGLPLTNFKDFGSNGERMVLSHFPSFNEICLTACFAVFTTFVFLQAQGYINGRVAVFICTLILVPLVYFWWSWTHMRFINSLILRNHTVVEQPIHLPGFTDQLVNEGVNFLKERSSDDKPFLLVMSWLQVHTAYHATRFKGKSAHGPYGDEVEELDWSVGEILKALHTLGFKNNTFVYFTSDNGGHIEGRGIKGNREGGHNGIFRGGKMQGGMEGGIRVPTVAMWPGTITAGSKIDVPTSLMDILPTIADILDVHIPQDRIIDGVSLMPLLSGHQLKGPHHKFMFHYCGDEVHAARYIPQDGSENVWKLYYATPRWHPGTQGCGFHCQCYGNKVNHHNPPLLYNIGRDPGEKVLCTPDNPCQPLTNSKQHHGIVDIIVEATEQHKKGLDTNIDNMYAWYRMMPRPWLQMCCNFPYCSCTERK